MSKFIRKIKPELIEKVDYENMKLPQLKKICEDNDIPTTGTKEELIKRLKMYDDDTYIKPVIYTTSDPSIAKTKKILFIGVHKNDNDAIMKVNKLVISGDARFHHYASDYYFFETQERIKLL